MPELPEVETIRKDLAARLTGRRFSRVEILDPRILTGFDPAGRPRRRADPASFADRIVGKTVRAVRRRGKYLVFELSGGDALLCHLRMTGQALWGAAAADARARFGFEGSEDVLSFRDQRRFGELWIASDWTRDPAIAALGPEPFGGALDAGAWGRALRASRAKVQAALLDQKRLAGLGNIYVTEALFRSGIRPMRRCRTLRAADIPRLLRNVRAVLETGLKHRGVSFYSYRDASGRKGDALKRLRVYGRADEPCPECGAALKGAKIGGRGTVYCPRCQK